MVKNGGAEPPILTAGRAFHKLVQEFYLSGATGPQHSRERTLRLGRRRGRADIIWRHAWTDVSLGAGGFLVGGTGDCLSIIEIKSTNWDAISLSRIRPNLRRHINQLYGYLDHALALIDRRELSETSLHVVYPRRPKDAEVLRMVEETMLSACIVPSWFNSIADPRQASQTLHFERHEEAAKRVLTAALKVASRSEVRREMRSFALRDPYWAVGSASPALAQDLIALTAVLQETRTGGHAAVVSAQRRDVECVLGLCHPCINAETISRGIADTLPAGRSLDDVPWWLDCHGSMPVSPFWQICRRLRSPGTWGDLIHQMVMDSAENNAARIAVEVRRAGYVGPTPFLLGQIRQTLYGWRGKDFYDCPLCGGSRITA